MAQTLTPFDAAVLLQEPEDIHAFLDEALEMGDPAFFAHALGVAARAEGRRA